MMRRLFEQVHVVVFAVHLHPRSLRVRADVGEDAARDVDRVRRTHSDESLIRRPNARVT
jgi:hypothetical protein